MYKRHDSVVLCRSNLSTSLDCLKHVEGVVGGVCILACQIEQ